MSKEKAKELHNQIAAGIEEGKYGKPEWERSVITGKTFHEDLVAYIMEKANMNSRQAEKVYVKAVANGNDLFSVLHLADEFMDFVTDIDRAGTKRELMFRKVTEHGSCNSCGAANYEPMFQPVSFTRTPVLYDLVIGRMVNRLCPDCLRAIGDKVDELLEE